MGIGDWGLGIGDWAQSPIPNPQSPIPNPQYINLNYKFIKHHLIIYSKYDKIIKYIILMDMSDMSIQRQGSNGIFIKVFHYKINHMKKVK